MIWLADRRQGDQIRQKVIEFLSTNGCHIFEKKEFYQFKMSFGHFWPVFENLTLKIPPFPLKGNFDFFVRRRFFGW